MITINVHNIKSMTARQVDNTSWLEVADSHGSLLALFMDFNIALELAEAFEDLRLIDTDEPEPVSPADSGGL